MLIKFLNEEFISQESRSVKWYTVTDISGVPDGTYGVTNGSVITCAGLDVYDALFGYEADRVIEIFAFELENVLNG